MSEKSRIVGADLGTMFFQVAEAEGDGVKVKTIRNAFVEISETDDIEDVLKQNSWQYVKDGNKYYVIGEDSLRVAKMFPGKVELRRPMQDGVLNKNEDKKMLILNEIVESAVGKSPDNNSVVCTCVSSPSIDDSADSTVHKAKIQSMFKRLGWNVKVIEEGLAVILAERPVYIEKDDAGNDVKSPYSGIGLSFGGGRTNCVLAYKGLQIIGMSVARGGDWIDKKVSEHTDKPIAQVASIKEKKLDFTKIDYDDEVLFALDAYYEAMIEFVFSNFAKKFAKVKSDFDGPIEIVIAGGTSMPKGFCTKLTEVIKKMELPFEVKCVRQSTDPRNSVVKGLLTQAILYSKQLAKGKKEEPDNGE